MGGFWAARTIFVGTEDFGLLPDCHKRTDARGGIRMGMTTKRLWWLMCAVLVLASCDEERKVVELTVVEPPRVARSMVRDSGSGSSGVVGAVIGGLVAGPVGAVVGYAVDAESPGPPTAEIVACQVDVATAGRRYRLEAYAHRMPLCSLLRAGDRIYGSASGGDVWVDGYTTVQGNSR